MYHLIYVSQAARPLAESELIEILRTSRENNASKNITGMLLYLNDKFIQVLEGEEKAVQELFDQISSDLRHNRVIRVLEGNAEQRTFKDWSMGFKQLYDTDEVEALTGFKDIDRFFSSDKTNNGNLLLTFLTIFYNKNITDFAELPD
ncbi:MAG: BLUF domain-containing protein [Cyclobacteriaceae bacterium]|nr:MAG: BLUF domain-containing protein [Cyclobacteriaceae bacterium]